VIDHEDTAICTRRAILLRAAAACAALAVLAACGRKAPPEVPAGTEDKFPRKYPAPPAS
jgi:hypothetical protein